MIHALLEELNGSAHTAFVYHTIMSPKDLLRYVCEDFGILPEGQAGGELHDYLILLNRFLLDSYRRGENVALIIDEAQNLSIEVLECIRLLSNFETTQDKLLQILLVGQPELRDKLSLPELRQLRQRIGLRCRIRPLTVEETATYIRARLRVAGTMDLGIFSDRAIERITEYSGGVPRLVNIVCDHCLVTAYADQKRRISPEMVAEAVQYLEEGRQPRRGSGRKEMLFGRLANHLFELLRATAGRRSLGVLTAVILIALTVFAFHVSTPFQTYLYDFAAFARDVRGLLTR
ncbi:MAG: AAA family ATPase [Deltaproteobacteria bacterium]|nr:AAA family ATPase [Deltaproteobacteria bacterium]